MTATQVARILGVSTETLRKWRARRMCLPYVRVGRHIRYKAADVAAFVERGTVMPDGKHGRGVPVIYTDFDDEDGGHAARNGHVGL